LMHIDDLVLHPLLHRIEISRESDQLHSLPDVLLDGRVLICHIRGQV
jgi:hypothetical protein